MKNNFTIDELHRVQKEMLKDLLDYFKENNIECFLIGGTLLGAVRHKGFIPWDDDIDLGMTRTNYRRLIELSKTKPIGKHYILSCLETDKTEFPFIKIYNTKIFVREKTKYKINNLWIDIFPFEGVPDDIEVQKKMYKKIMDYKRKLNFRMMDKKYIKVTTSNKIKRIIKYIVKPFVNLLPVDYYARKMDKYALKMSPKNYKKIGDIVWGSDICDTFDKEELNNLIYLEFEGLKIKSIPHYKDFLTRCYGDYMKLPPKNKRESHIEEVWSVDDEKTI